MSEHLPASHEHEHHEHKARHENHEAAKPDLEKAAQQARENAPNLEEIRASIHQEAKPDDEILAATSEKESEQPPQVMTRDIKQQAFNKTLKRVQSRLNPTERAFSKVVHQPVVDKFSTVTAKTVARPSGILTGGICALLGSLGLLYLSKTYGFTYNYLVFFATFIIGYAVGVGIELIIWVLLRQNKREI
ncbi:MAG: hypothetical protein JWS12_316 [Candidatus Saccharibacteria bacterium]|nr:hypothetical protein [Candidatus Saccharibacteria bacterium]